MPELKRIDFEKGQFTGLSGKTYFVESSLSVARYAEFQILEKEMAYGLTTKGLFDKLKALFEMQNKMKFAESAVMLNDLMRGVAKLQERQPVILKICCLYINLEDEDRGVITQDMIDKKIADWEDVDIRDFFTLAVRSVNGLIEIYATVTQAISELAAQGNE